MRKTNTITIYNLKGERFHIHPIVAKRLGIENGYKAKSQDEINNIITDNILYNASQSNNDEED